MNMSWSTSLCGVWQLWVNVGADTPIECGSMLVLFQARMVVGISVYLLGRDNGRQNYSLHDCNAMRV